MGSLHWPRATRRSICSSVGAALTLASFGALPAAASSSGIEAGRASARMVLVFRDPRVCAIALFRSRCRSDLNAFFGKTGDAGMAGIPNVGKHPISGLRAFIETGNRDALDPALGDMNGTSAPPAQWRSDPHTAAQFDAGAEDVLLPAAAGNLVAELLALGPYAELTHYAAQVPAGTLPVGVPPPARAGMAPSRAAAAAFVAALDRSSPAPRLFAAFFPRRPLTDPQLGIAMATVAELIDSPAWLAQGDSQRFVSDFFDELSLRAPAGTRSGLQSIRASLRVGSAFDNAQVSTAYAHALSAVLAALPQPRARRIVLGNLAAQFPYNAAVLRQTASSDESSRAFAAMSDLDNDVPGFAGPRAQAAIASTNDWSAQYRAGIALVEAIRKAGPP